MDASRIQCDSMRLNIERRNKTTKKDTKKNVFAKKPTSESTLAQRGQNTDENGSSENRYFTDFSVRSFSLCALQREFDRHTRIEQNFCWFFVYCLWNKSAKSFKCNEKGQSHECQPMIECEWKWWTMASFILFSIFTPLARDVSFKSCRHSTPLLFGKVLFEILVFDRKIRWIS